MWTSQTPAFSSAVALKKNSPYTKILNSALHKLMERGTTNIYKNRFSRDILSCSTTKSNTTRKGNPLGISKLAFLFLMLFIGLTLSLFVSIFEFFHRPKQLEPKQKFGKEYQKFKNSCQNLLPNLNHNLQDDILKILSHVNYMMTSLPDRSGDSRNSGISTIVDNS